MLQHHGNTTIQKPHGWQVGEQDTADSDIDP